MVGWLLSGAFVALIVSFLCTDYLLARFVARHRLRIDERRRMSAVFLASFLSLEILWACGLAFTFASGTGLYGEVLLGCVAIQAIWLCRHLWLFHRDHLRVAADRRMGSRLRGSARS